MITSKQLLKNRLITILCGILIFGIPYFGLMLMWLLSFGAFSYTIWCTSAPFILMAIIYWIMCLVAILMYITEVE